MPRAGSQKSVSRRAFVGALAGAPVLLPALRAGALTKPAVPLPLPPGADTLGQGTFQLFSASDLNFQTLIALGGAGINSAVGEVITAVDQAKAAPGGASYQSLFDAMVATGNRMVEAAEAAAKKKHTVTARERYLRAAQYYNQALYWVLGTSTPDREAAVYRAMDDAWKQAAKRSVPVWEPVSVPYGKSTLPAWFLKPSSGGGRRPTLIMNNGSDGQNVDMLPQGGSAALARGWNVLVFEGPGQGSLLFERQVPFTPDWHEVISPIVDVLQKRTDVDPKRIALLGVSFGGLLVMRAAAFEHRLAAVVPDPGSYDDFIAFPEALRTVASSGDEATVNRTWAEVIVPGADPADVFALKKRLEIFTTEAHAQALAGKVPTDWYAISRQIQKFTLGDLARKVKTPALLVAYELENFVPGQAETLSKMLPGRKDLVTFTVVEGSQYHDAPMGSQWHGEVVMDWLQETVG